MKTMTTMKSLAIAAMMMIATTASATTNTRSTHNNAGFNISIQASHNNNHGAIVVSGRGHGPEKPIMHECNCRDCKKVRKALDKHMRKFHNGRQTRMACHTCMEYSHILKCHAEMLNNHHHRR